MIREELNEVNSYTHRQNNYSRNLYQIAVDEVSELIECVADRNSIVIAYGDSEISRELVARSLHIQSSRHDHKFVSINCAAIPKNLIASELFGYKKGIHASSQAGRMGHFEMANNGTLFLDEIDDLDDEIQQKLLQVIQTGSIRRVGESESRKVDVRLIVGTRHDLSELARAGSFRNDLIYRLNIFPIHIPSSRGHTEDLQLLVHAITSKIKEQLRFDIPIKQKAFRTVLHYMWAGDSHKLSELLENLSILYSIGELKLGNTLKEHTE
jgi:sigma-54 specific flagellar transcriptional regulator A